MSDDYGPWEPLSIDQVVELFEPLELRWWIAGGHALEQHVGRPWRAHADIDIGICRRDVRRLAPLLARWAIWIAAAGELSPWNGEELDASRQQNNLWVRRLDGPWVLDVLIGDGDERGWIYRRDPSLTMPWSDALVTAPGGYRYLTPWLQLLFKSQSGRTKDDHDAEIAIPTLSEVDRARLFERLPEDHVWKAIGR